MISCSNIVKLFEIVRQVDKVFLITKIRVELKLNDIEYHIKKLQINDETK